jgi:aspartate/methionine/tyrosine aminotransferase
VTLLEQERVAVHPGYFFDFASDGFLVVSLLTPPDVFAEGARRILRGLPR